VALARLAAGIGHPQVAVAIDGPAMGEDEHALPEARQQLAVLVELQNRRLTPPAHEFSKQRWTT
jgi:hypothetical protein